MFSLAPLSFSLLLPLFLSPSILATSTTESYDIILIGGGTSGLTLANRLSGNSNLSILIIEAGGDASSNPNVTNVNAFTSTLDTPIDWAYQSTVQSAANRRVIEYHAGKALGGTSNINGMTYVRAEKAQLDAWETVGNPGWNWDSLFPYYLKSENFTIPTTAQIEDGGASFVPSYHGEDGGLKVGYPYGLQNGSLFDTVEQTWAVVGIPRSEDVNGGSVRGFTAWQSTLDRDANVRETAERAFYFSVEGRENLHLLLNTTVRRIVWRDGEEVVASGVEILSEDGTVSTLKAEKEVIVCAGSLRSPGILELSGIGNSNILDKLNIPVKVSLPGVGENLQDQPNNDFAYSFNTTIPFDGQIPYITYSSQTDFFPSAPSINASIINAWAALILNSTNSSIPTSSISQLLTIQNTLISNRVPNAETIIESTISIGSPASTLLFSAFWALLPFSRGNIHISTSDPAVLPSINPNFFLVDWDLDVQIAVARFTRGFFETQPIASLVTEILPGLETVPANATDGEWGEWIVENFSSNSHPVGTCAMMSEELGGVVDSKLKVYGTENVRVVDASIWPFQLSGHLTSTIYAIAEKAADVILEEYS